MTDLRENERIDDLEINGFRIIQNPLFFCFGMDAVLLANFADVGEDRDVIDLGTGTGIVPLLLAAKGKGRSWKGIEIQADVADMARRSVELNGIQDKCEIVVEDICNLKNHYQPGSFGAVTTNPPYMKDQAGIKNPNNSKYISRHETSATLEDIVSMASYLLKTRGSFTMVHRPSRLPEIMALMTKYRLEPKRMQLVQPYVDKPANMVLIEGIKEGGQELKLLPTLIVYEADGSYTKELLRYYGKEL